MVRFRDDETKKFKILLLTKHFPPDIGGTETYIKNFLNFLKKRQSILVDVLTFQPLKTKKKLPKVSKEGNIKIFRLCLVNPNRFDHLINYELKKLPSSLRILVIYLQLLLVNFFHFFYFLTTGFWHLFRNKINLIYAVGGVFAATSGSVLSMIFKKHLVIHLHVNMNLSQSVILKNLTPPFFKRADYILVNSLDVKKEMLRVGLNKDKIVIVRNWVDQKIFSPMSQKKCREKLGLPRNKFILLFATSLSKIKGIELVLDVVRELRNSQDFLFLFGGNGAFRGEVEKFQERSKNVVYFGELKNEDLPLYINASDICWGVCDTYYISINTIESLACGVPVIARNIAMSVNKKVSKRTLPPEVGFLVRPNSQEIAEKLISLNDDRAKLKKMSKECVKFVKDNYGYHNAEEVYGIFMKVMDSNQFLRNRIL